MDTRLRTLIVDPFVKDIVDDLKQSPILNCDYTPGISDEELTWAISDYEVLIVRGARHVSSIQILAASNLRFILVAATSADKIDTRAAALKGIEIITSPGVSYEATAELAIANTINLLRHITQADKLMKSGIWNRSSLIGERIAGKRALILGYGRMGKKIASYLKVFGAEVSAWGNRSSHDSDVAWIDNLEMAISQSDLIYICLSCTSETKGIISAELISSMKPTSILVNVGRGELIDEKALFQHLKSRKIAGAAIDVWQREPNYHFSMAGLDNVIATPHIGGNTKCVHEQMISNLIHELSKRINHREHLLASAGGLR